MLSDRELFVQIIERDVLNLYQSLAKTQNLLNLPMVENMVFSYADKGIEYITNLFFGIESNVDIEEASEIAKLVANDKIEEYRNKIREQKNS